MLKYKRTLWIVFAVIFVVVLFLVKTTSIFKNKETYQKANEESGLTYSNMTLEDLVNKDTDGDGILDWQENLYGLDPTKKETTPGTPDSVTISKMKDDQGNSVKIADKDKNNIDTENLSQTDKFSRELFATIAATSKNGAVDQATIDKLGASLAEKIKNPVVRKVFLISEIKTIDDNSAQALKNYLIAFDDIHRKYPDIKYTVLDVLQKFMVDENNIDSSVLVKLDPIIEQNSKIITALTKMNVPQSIASLHLDIINSLERLGENASDIRLFDTDPIVTLGGISQYQKNVAQLELSLKNFLEGIKQKLSN